MFFDIGPLELVALVVLAVLVFGPDKLPKVIQDTMAFIRKVREFSDSAKEDIRRELGPEFKDFEFEDLNPKTFIRKNLMSDEDEYGLKELRELGSSLDLRKEMAEVTDAVNGVDTAAPAARKAGTATAAASGTPGPTTPDRLRKREQLDEDEPPPFDADAT
ncbi:sec-independent translocase [Streptomyces cocklensis]|uniref:Sec-independent protein translocase protein TatB n=1 Tax=Actinacidiphila cocklensis TaxID=887465 RepID=A0A9W4GT13_9ACTN|nr:sec-independent translocase [Actinacidiphila cocklensis]MDD1062748.1 sec-independent translocase [Actinacidiphila cocklensis]WSX76987.1 sec-independent translocase [Streptomyces sp. NBC_00899]CAG6396023.1 Sec-independent protein translocase protein TatB [Actinacidiphila cocklensis]